MRIRIMIADDVPEVLDLWRSCEGVGLSEADTVEGIGAFLVRNHGMSCVATSDGRPIGAILAGHDGRRGFLYHLAVHADFRKRGVARQLVADALSRLRVAGISKCHVMVYRDNEVGRKFWDHLGWRRRDDIDVHSVVFET